MSSISDIVNAKIIELLLETCRKTVIECSQHYGFSSEEALGKMGLLTDFSNLYISNGSSNGNSNNSEENVSVSDVSVKTPILVKKVSKPRVKKEKVEVVVSSENPEGISTEAKAKKVSKPRVKKEKVPVPEGVVTEGIVTEGVVPVTVTSTSVEKPKKVSKPRVKKEKVAEGVVTEGTVTSVVPEVEKAKKVSKPRVKKEKKEGEEDSVSSSPKVKGEKGRPKKEKKETEVTSPIDDLFANLVAKEEEAPQVDVVNKMEFQGTTYLKSKNTGIIYNMDQDVVGKWNENTNTIDFEEEEEEEYEDE
jgi:hypothetical protein